MTENPLFARWTRQTAFNLTLNETAISNLLAILDWEDRLRDPEDALHGPGRLLPVGALKPDRYGFQLYCRGQINYLEKRGLIRFANDIPNNVCNYVLTEPGTHVARLLRCAGFSNRYVKEPCVNHAGVESLEAPTHG